MQDCRTCKVGTAYGAENICEVCQARLDFETIQAKYHLGKVDVTLYEFYLHKLTEALKKVGLCAI